MKKSLIRYCRCVRSAPKTPPQIEAQWRRGATLAVELWGRTPADLQRQLLARYPAIPGNVNLADLRRLHQTAQKLAAAPQLAFLCRSSRTVTVGTQSFTEWEARCEIARRAIDYLEKFRGN